MNKVNINMTELLEYIDNSFYGDNEIINLYDKSQSVRNIQDVCQNIYHKIVTEYPDGMCFGIESNEEKIGYFVTYKNLLVSFCLNIKYRTKEYLIQFFEFIKNQFGGTFECLLYSYNKRGINWLKKSGMKLIFENVSLLQFEQ